MYSNKSGRRKKEQKPNKVKKHGKSLGSKKNEKISLHERSETNCSFIGKPKADIDGGQKGRGKENTVERAVSKSQKIR